MAPETTLLTSIDRLKPARKTDFAVRQKIFYLRPEKQSDEESLCISRSGGAV